MKNQRDKILANHDIRYKDVRLVTDAGSEILSTNKARTRAENDGLDLVLINSAANPPICKILELAKYRYDLKRKEKETAKAQRESRVSIKEVQFKPNIDEHDFQTKCRNITRFINKGSKVKVLVQFRGRERHHSDLGYAIIDRILSLLDDVELDGKLQFSGNRITAMLKGSQDGT